MHAGVCASVSRQCQHSASVLSLVSLPVLPRVCWTAASWRYAAAVRVVLRRPTLHFDIEGRPGGGRRRHGVLCVCREPSTTPGDPVQRPD